MKRFRIQVYDRDMRKLVREYEKVYDGVSDALSDAFVYSGPDAIVTLMVNNDSDSRLWKLIAKFY